MKNLVHNQGMAKAKNAKTKTRTVRRQSFSLADVMEMNLLIRELSGDLQAFSEILKEDDKLVVDGGEKMKEGAAYINRWLNNCRSAFFELRVERIGSDEITVPKPLKLES